MNIQTIKTLDGQEYVLLPLRIYNVLKQEIDERLSDDLEDEYVPFILEKYIENPVALLRIKAHVTQAELAELMHVSQAYVSKIENKRQVSMDVLSKVELALLQGKKDV